MGGAAGIEDGRSNDRNKGAGHPNASLLLFHPQMKLFDNSPSSWIGATESM